MKLKGRPSQERAVAIEVGQTVEHLLDFAEEKEGKNAQTVLFDIDRRWQRAAAFSLLIGPIRLGIVHLWQVLFNSPEPCFRRSPFLIVYLHDRHLLVDTNRRDFCPPIPFESSHDWVGQGAYLRP